MKMRHEIYFKLMGGFASLVALLCVVMALNACALLDQHSGIVNLAVSQVTLRYIEQAPVADRAVRAQRVITVAEKIKAATVGDKPVTIAQLADFALSFIPANLEPSDRALAVSLVQIAAQELSNKVGTGELPADAKVKVSEILLTITSAASYFLAH